MRGALLAAVVSLSLLASLALFLVHGSYFAPESWYHINVAKEALARGHIRVWDEYGTDWPLINMLVALFSEETGLPPAKAALIASALVGLAVLPILMLVRTLERRSPVVLLLMMILILDPSRTTQAGAILKQTAAAFPYAAILYVLFTRRCWRTLPLLAAALALAHHYTSLTALMLIAAIIIDDRIKRLRGEPSAPSPPLEPIAAILVLALYQAIIGPRHTPVGPTRLEEAIALLLIFIAMYALSLLYRGSPAFKASSLIVASAILALLSYFAYRGTLFSLPLPRPDLPALLVGAAYLALAAYTIRRAPPDAPPIFPVIAALLLYSLTYDPTYASVQMLIKASRVALPLLIIAAAYARPDTKSSILLLLPALIMLHAFLRTLQGAPQIGAAAIYDAGEVLEMTRIAPLLPRARGSSRFYLFMSAYLHHPAGIFDPLKPEGLLVILRGDLERGFVIFTSWVSFRWEPDGPQEDLLMMGGYLYVVNRR